MSSAPVSDPLARFGEIYARAKASDPQGYDATCLATVGDDGRPAARMVLLKQADAQGFVIYTNLGSRKGSELLRHPWAALCFYWPKLYEQVRVEGAVERVSEEEADAYFASRARGSQIGAWASRQSSPLDMRETLLQRFAEIERRYEGSTVPRPAYWSGLRIVPDRYEFWIGQENRLHIRTRYARAARGWEQELLYP
jgi:pyridoxamine 5'-phosphate oxidase